MLIIHQVNGDFDLKEISLVANGISTQKLVKSFSNTRFEHVPRPHQKQADWALWVQR